ncbi:MAG: T9SS type A sorting domain-containing protein [Ignavibacteria bacterium]|nr:T9SS type A sorting domain-containing protein [Ignavibacteria bacterium]
MFSQGWNLQTNGFRKYIVVNFINQNTGFILSQDKTILKTTNLGLNWNIEILNVSTPPPAKNANFLNDSVYGIIFTNQIYLTTNKGLNWNYFSIYPAGNGIVELRSILLINKTTAYVCGNDFGTLDDNIYLDGIIYKSTNSGISWNQSHRGGIDYYDIKFKDSLSGYSNQYGIIKTSNAGNLWEYHGSIRDFTFSLSDIFNDTIYACGDSGKIFRSINDGVDWIKFYTPASDTLTRIYFTDSKTGYAVGDGGTIIKTTNAGVNWALQVSHTTANLNGLWFINKDTGFAVGDNGVILSTITGGLTGINYQPEVTNYFNLFQNYPNPFNPSTKIRYTLLKEGNVKITIYNSIGQKINELVNELKNAGEYIEEFNGTDLSSGIYFYRFESEGFFESRRMLLLK